jgi:hypothetical protein
MELLGDVGQVEACFGRSRHCVNLDEDTCMICDERTMGSEIILDTLDDTPT